MALNGVLNVIHVRLRVTGLHVALNGALVHVTLNEVLVRVTLYGVLQVIERIALNGTYVAAALHEV